MIEIRHMGLYVKDLERMKHFYVQILGMKEVTHDFDNSNYINMVLGVKQAEVELYKLIADNGTMLELINIGNIEVIEQRKELFVWEQGNSHLAFTVLDIDGEYKRLTEYGLEFISTPCLSENGYAKVCFCKDPEGNFLEIVEVQ